MKYAAIVIGRTLVAAVCLAATPITPATPASAGVIDTYTPAVHDRFVGGEVMASGNVVNPSFLLADYDVSALGVSNNGGVLISDRHVLVANHFRSGSYAFVGADGVRRAYSVSGHTRLNTDNVGGPSGLSDIAIATLSTPINLSVAGLVPMPLARSSLENLEGRELFAYDQRDRVGRNVIDGGRTANGQTLPGTLLVTDQNGNLPTYVTAFDFDTASNGGTGGLGRGEIGLIGGDSGHASMIVTPHGQLALLGAHFSVDRENPQPSENYLSFSSIVAPYLDQVVSLVTADGGLDFSTALIAQPGDANADGQVSLADFLILREHFGGAGGFAEGDFNGDDLVSLGDFLILRANFGDPDVAQGLVIPEPAVGLLALPLLLLARRRR